MANELSKGRRTTVPRLSMPSPSALEALRVLQTHLASEKEEEVPPDYFPARYWSVQWNKSIRRTTELLSDAIRTGLVDVIPTKKGRYFRFKIDKGE